MPAEVDMNTRLKTLTMILGFVLSTNSLFALQLHHELRVHLDPQKHHLSVVDTISHIDLLSKDKQGAFRFFLHAGLSPELEGSGWSLEKIPGDPQADFLGINATTESLPENIEIEAWKLIPKTDDSGDVRLRYSGTIFHPLARQGEEYQRSFSETPGTISPEGVFLSGTTFWIPAFGDGMISFNVEVDGLSPNWEIISQGRRTRHENAEDTRTVAWSADFPTEEVYLVGGPLKEYESRQGDTEIFAFLRTPDEGLATRYINATARYLRMYESILPDYPFASFSLVENFWETGYGMPGFTLLGPKIIRFPWILTSSYPHELLHNWWGNSVYVDFPSGNWCEGLTAYMADHMLAEQRGEGRIYRRSTLKKFTDLVTQENDFPLTEFHNRFSGASEAVGYGKALMLFHMMRRSVGDAAFLRALTRYYHDHQFKQASFGDIAASFYHLGGPVLAPFVKEWTSRTGAPRLVLGKTEILETRNSKLPFTLRLELSQQNVDSPFPLEIPIAVTVEGKEKALWHVEKSCGASCNIEIPCPGRPLRVDIDPEFDLMRRLDPREVPPAISTLMGAKAPLFILSSRAPEAEVEAWKNLAESWAAPEKARMIRDDEIMAFPKGAFWILGRNNRFAGELVWRLAEQGVHFDGENLILGTEKLPAKGRSLVLIARDPAMPEVAAGFIAADPIAAIPGLARKLPHYQKYSYLAFKGEEPSNTLKGMWTPIASPLVRKLVKGNMPELHLEKREALTPMPPIFQAEDFEKSVRFLADPALEGRGLGTEGLAEATKWVEARMKEIGLDPAGSRGFRQAWTIRAGEPEREMELINLIGKIPGQEPDLDPVFVTAHLDHLGRGWPDVRSGNEGKIHPGADDNASGVAVLLELARAMKAEPARPRTILFAVVTGEEAGLIGSRHLVSTLKDPGIFADLNIDTVGRLSEGALYVLNTDSAREWRFIFMGVGYTTGAPVKIVSEALDASDQGAFLEAGIPAVQLFTGPTADYHRPGDTPEKLDFPGMSTVTEAAKEVVAYLAERKEALEVHLETGKTPGTTEVRPPARDAGSQRKVSLGTMPDFAFSGPGIRVQAVMPGSAAEEAGIKAGDILLEIDGSSIDGLRGLSRLLKEHQPGDSVSISLKRETKEINLPVQLRQR